MTFALLFFLERLHHTRLLVPAVFVCRWAGGCWSFFATAAALAFSARWRFCRSSSIDPMAKMDAEASSEWRVKMWREVIPQIPHYLLVGKGYGFSATEQAQLGQKMEGVELVGDYHNGPLSVILPFGIFGSIGFHLAYGRRHPRALSELPLRRSCLS